MSLLFLGPPDCRQIRAWCRWQDRRHGIWIALLAGRRARRPGAGLRADRLSTDLSRGGDRRGRQRKRDHLLDWTVGGHLRLLWLAEPRVGSDSLRTVQLAGEWLVSGSKRPVNPGLASLQASTETLRVPPRCGAVKYAAAPRAPACGALLPPPENAAIPALSAVLRRSTGRRSWGSRSSRERQSAWAQRPSPASATTRRSRCLGKR